MTQKGRVAEPPAPERASSHWPHPMRDYARLALSATFLVALFQYVRFWKYVQTGSGGPVSRPNVVDAFLPLGGLAGLKAWLATGYFDAFHPAAIVILVAILLTAWLFRRAPCAWLCPFGLVSEHLAKLGARFFGKHIAVPPWLDRSLLALKYAGTLVLLWWLLSAPVGTVVGLMNTPYYAVADMKLFGVYTKLGLGMVVALGAIAFASLRVKSAWCRYLCPYGALQGLLGTLSPMVLSKDDSICTNCKRCNRACPNGVDISSARGSVVSAECMGCTSCVASCPQEGAIALRVGGRRRLDPVAFTLAFFAVFLAVVTFAIAAGRFGNGLPPELYRSMFQMSSDVRLPW